MKGIRLTDWQVIEICKAFRSCFLPEDCLWLFGSRVDLSRRGGDIDLYIETNINDHTEISKSKLQFLTKLIIALGDQKIDIVIKGNDNLLIYTVAKTEGIKLI